MPIETPLRSRLGTAGFSNGSSATFPVFKNRYPVPPIALGAVHRGVGFFDDVLHGFVRIGASRNPETGGRLNGRVFELMTVHEEVSEFFGDNPPLLGIARVEIEEEFLSAHASKNGFAVIGKPVLQNRADALEQLVAHGMSVPVVDQFEMVDIDHDEREPLMRTDAAEVSDPFEKSEPVMESSELVFAGAAMPFLDEQMPLHPFEMGTDRPGDLSELGFDEVDRNFEPVFGYFEKAHRRTRLRHVAGNSDGDVRFPGFEFEVSSPVDGDASGEIGIGIDGAF